MIVTTATLAGVSGLAASLLGAALYVGPPPSAVPASEARDYAEVITLEAPEVEAQPEPEPEPVVEPEPAQAEPAEAEHKPGTVTYTPAPDDRKTKRSKFRKWWRDRGHRFIIVPSFRADPTIGAMPGIRVRYVRRLPGQSFNRVQVDLGLRLSTKLVQQHDLRVRLRDFLGKNELWQFGILVFDDPVFPYIGINDESEYDNRELDDPFYQADVLTIGGFANYQQPVWSIEPHEWGKPIGVLRWLVGVDFQADWIQQYEDSRLQMERPSDAGWTRRGSYVGGVTWDSRDNEWSPKQGGLHDATLAIAGPWAGSTEYWGRLHTSFRWYRSLGTKKLVFAQRLAFDALVGDVPLYELGRYGGLFDAQGFGGRRAGRGFFRRRYAAPVKGLSLTEFRYQPFEWPILRRTVGLGFKAFADIGEIFQPDGILADGLHIAGGGGLFLVWDRFFVFRADVGVSREGVQWYVLSGHAF